MPSAQGRYWLGTLYSWTVPVECPAEVSWCTGQEETCPTTARKHHQVYVAFKRSVRLAVVKRVIGEGHWELSRSSAAEDYCTKDASSVPGTRFMLGKKPMQRNNSVDWESIKHAAKCGDLESVPADVYIRYYSSLKKIASDNQKGIAVERSCEVFWGVTGSGKSRRAWEEATMDAYVKDPRTKWWCGYRGQKNVVIDEFRGDIAISHLLRWLDRYPVLVETKGGSVPLGAEKFWITSNVDPRNWYLDLDSETKLALLRRLNITHFN